MKRKQIQTPQYKILPPPTQDEKTKSRKRRNTRILIFGLGLSLTGLAVYLMKQYFDNQKEKEKQPAKPPSNDVPDYSKSGGTTSSGTQTDSPTYEPVYTKPEKTNPVYIPQPNGSNSDSFPLKKGSRGEYVRQLQQALMDNHGVKILPKYGADGVFGNEVIAALKKLKYPTTVSQSLFNVIVKTESSTNSGTGKDADTASGSAKQKATDLFMALSARNYVKTMSVLNSINSVEMYSEVNTHFLTKRLFGIRKTVVTGTLDTFTDAKQKQAIRMSFIRMGLQYDGNKFTLSGLSGLQIKTLRPTEIWSDKGQTAISAGGVVLGQLLAQRMGLTLFESGGNQFIVLSNDVQVI